VRIEASSLSRSTLGVFASSSRRPAGGSCLSCRLSSFGSASRVRRRAAKCDFRVSCEIVHSRAFLLSSSSRSARRTKRSPHLPFQNLIWLVPLVARRRSRMNRPIRQHTGRDGRNRRERSYEEVDRRMGDGLEEPNPAVGGYRSGRDPGRGLCRTYSAGERAHTRLFSTSKPVLTKPQSISSSISGGELRFVRSTMASSAPFSDRRLQREENDRRNPGG